jgi:hypothetical protein
MGRGNSLSSSSAPALQAGDFEGLYKVRDPPGTMVLETKANEKRSKNLREDGK